MSEEEQSDGKARPINGVTQELDILDDDASLGVILPTAATRAVAKEWALVLTSQGMKSRIEQTQSGYALVVHPDDALGAVQILSTWREENISRPIPDDLATPSRGHPLDYVAAIVAVMALLGFHLSLERSEDALLFYRVGRSSAYQIMHGELWRIVTALTLHSGLGHAVGNTLIGGFFLVSLAGRVGAGFALAGAVVTGALGNLANAIHHQSAHSSIGASTAVFGVVGLLCGVEAWRRKRLALPWRGAWVPLGAGVALLAMLGTGGARTDLGAHVFGLLAGMTLGLAAAPPFSPKPPGVREQIVAGVVSLAVLYQSWSWALGSLAK